MSRDVHHRPGRGRRYGAALVLGAGLLLASACAGPRMQVRTAPQLAKFEPRVVVVYPYSFRWPEPPWRAYQKSRDLVDAVLSEGRHLVVGPSEVRVRSPELDNVAGGSDVMNVLARMRVPAKNAVVLRGWAEERVATSAAVMTGADGSTAGMSQSRRRTLVAHLEAIHVWSGRTLVDATATVELDPFAVLPDWDPLQPLTEVNRRLAREVLARLGGELREVETGARLQVNPSAAFEFKVREGTESGASGLARLGPLEQDVVRLSVYRYFDAELPPERVRLYRKAPTGALVDRVEGGAAASAGLQPGDVIIRIGRVPVRGPETVHRRLALASAGEDVPAVVDRAGERRTVMLSAP